MEKRIEQWRSLNLLLWALLPGVVLFVVGSMAVASSSSWRSEVPAPIELGGSDEPVIVPPSVSRPQAWWRPARRGKCFFATRISLHFTLQ